jgi:hypothetical protein
MNFNMMKEKQNNLKEYAISFRRANIYSFVLMFLIILSFTYGYGEIWGYGDNGIRIELIKSSFLFVFLLGIVFHEILHGLTWSIYAKSGFKSIKFGFKWKHLTPFCHCTEELKVKHYKRGAVMPLLVLGLLPSIYAVIVGNSTVFFYGLVFTCVSAGDIIVLFMLRKLNNEIYIFDHPNKMGFYVKSDTVSQS